jgi:hypothetical protein
MKKLILLIFTTSLIFANNYNLKFNKKKYEYNDFGVYGKLYPIIEEPFMEILNKKMNDYKLSKNSINEEIVNQIKMSAFESTNKPLCKDNEILPSETDYQIIKMDIFNPFGRLIYKKGDKIKSEIKGGKKLNLCFINFKNEISGKNQISKFKNKDCMFIVANKNVLSLRKDYPNLKIYPTSKEQENRFNVKCYPAIIHMEKDQIQKNYFSYEQFKN